MKQGGPAMALFFYIELILISEIYDLNFFDNLKLG